MNDQTPSTDVVLSYAEAPVSERYRYARILADAGALVPKGLRDPDGSPNPSRVMYALEMGAALGFHPIVALGNIHVIEGKVTLSADLMQAVVRKQRHRMRVWNEGSGKTLKGIATIHRVDDPDFEYRAEWDLEKAGTARLLGKDVWKSYPAAMLRSRAISEVCKMGATDVLFGAMTPEELGAPVDENGDIIDGEIVEDAAGTGAQGDTGKRGHANETQVRTASDRQPTPGSGPRPSPSRAVASPGAGRAAPVPEPSEEQQAAIHEFADAITETDSVNALRTLHADADRKHLLAYPTREGVRLNDLFHARKAHLQQQAQEDLPPALDGLGSYERRLVRGDAPPDHPRGGPGSSRDRPVHHRHAPQTLATGTCRRRRI
jgi:hypothetical protein